MSMADVSRLANTSDTKISNLENDKTREPSPVLLKALARIYKISVFDLFLRYGFIDEEQYNSVSCFKKAEYLSEEERSRVQDHIDFYIYLREKRGQKP